MTFRLSNWPISRQVLVAFAFAIVALMVLSAGVVAERWREMSAIANLRTLVDATTAIGALSHELQKERGASALFLGSQGKQFRAELDTQRTASDAAAKAFGAALVPLRGSAAFRDFLAVVADAESQLTSLATRRGEIDRLALKGPESFAFYTRTISGLLDSTYAVSRITGDADLKNVVFAYAAFMQGKERAGQERATGSAGFATGKFDGALYQRLTGLIAAQDTFFSVFRGIASNDLTDALRSRAEGRELAEVQELRRVALDAGIGGDLKGTPAAEWFKRTTARIDAMKAVEDRTAATLQDLAANKADRATLEFAVLLAVALAGSGLALAIGFLVVRSITRAIGGLTAATQRIAAGDVQVSVPGDDRGDEVGALARAIHEIRSAGVSAMRIKTALDNVSANAMMADTDGHIIYMNRAVLEMFEHAEADIRAQLPGFAAGKLLGSSIDAWHRNPSVQRGTLSQLTGSHRARIKVGVRSFDLIATPVLDAEGTRHGIVVEWRDVTQMLVIQDEVAAMVQAASDGDFSKRVALAGKEGFMLELARSMNALAETSAHSLEGVVGFLAALASGDLSKRIEGDHRGMYGRIKDDANRTAERLGDIVARIVAAADTIGTASSEISMGSTDLAERTEQQASNLEETAASMEELGATVRSNADNAQRANRMAEDARKAAESGGNVAGSAIEAMRRIEEASRKITDIIGVIDEIAFQTNLLALNAAVEAARAGDAGRGFAVVAQEVRQLAQRSAQASKEIKALILASGTQVKDGVELVQKAGGALGGIVSGVHQVASLISEMATASTEQASALDEINATVAQMDEMTQRNAALVEETTAAAQSLANQAGDLRRLISFFRRAG